MNEDRSDNTLHSTIHLQHTRYPDTPHGQVAVGCSANTCLRAHHLRNSRQLPTSGNVERDCTRHDWSGASSNSSTLCHARRRGYWTAIRHLSKHLQDLSPV